RHSFPVYFDDEPRTDVVTFAVVPFDAFSGQVVSEGVKAELEGLPNRPIKNLSGHLVFINLPDPPDGSKYKVDIDASKAGNFSPESEFFPPDDPDLANTRRLPVKLMRRPDFPYAEATTLIRGVVVRGKDPVVGASIWIEPFPKPRLLPAE